MRTPFRVLLAAAALAAAAVPAAASPPSAGAGVSAQRSFSFEHTSGWDRLTLRIEHTRGRAGAGSGAGSVGGESWDACVYSSTRTGWFSGCATPTGLTFDIPPGSATGKVRFTLRESWGGVAVADLTLTDAGATPTVSYELQPYGTSLRPVVSVARLATLKGTVRVTTTRYGTTRAATRTYALSNIPVSFRESVSASVHAYPGV